MRNLETLGADLRTELLAGADTASIRRAIAEAEAAESLAVREAAQREAERAAEEARRLRREAEDIAATAVRRIAETLAALEPPAAP